MKLFFTFCALLLAATVSAQPRPGSFTTIVTTGTITDGGLLTVTGFGLHSITAAGTGPEQLTVRNTIAGSTNRSVFNLGNDVTTTLTSLESHSSTYASSLYRQANGGVLLNVGAGGLSIASSNDTNGTIKFFSGSFSVVAERMRIQQSGGITIGGTTDPGANNLQIDGGGGIVMTSVPFASLPSSTNGTILWCGDCAPTANPCTGAATGSFAFRQNGAWVCF